MTDLEALLARVEAASGPDRELDAELWVAMTPGVTRKSSVVKSSTGAWPDYTIDETRDETGSLIIVPSFTSFIDAAVALCERVLPGIGRTVTNKPVPEAWIFGDCEEDGNNDHLIVDMISNAKAATEPLALLAAILRAKIAEAKNT